MAELADAPDSKSGIRKNVPVRPWPGAPNFHINIMLYVREDIINLANLLSDELINSAIKPSVLFHYTNANSFYKILESKNLWASNIYFLNDSLEYKLSVHLFLIRLFHARKSRFIDKETIKLIEDIEIRCAQINNDREFVPSIFIVSLSSKGNSIGQWRAYGGENGGFCIGFDFQKLKNACTTQQAKLIPCIYDSNQHIILANNLITKIIESYFRHKSKPDFSYTDFVEIILYEVTFLAAYIKHPGFVEEDEWRIILSPDETNIQNIIKFYPSRTTIRPYIELRFDDSFSSYGIGPYSFSEHSKPVIDLFLNKMKYDVTKISCHFSGIPLRANP